MYDTEFISISEYERYAITITFYTPQGFIHKELEYNYTKLNWIDEAISDALDVLSGFVGIYKETYRIAQGMKLTKALCEIDARQSVPESYE